MKIEAGKFYRTKCDRKVGPAEWRADGGYFRLITGGHYTADGLYAYLGKTPRDETDANLGPTYDIVSEWTDEPTGPVITETVKRIVPGTYGQIVIGPHPSVNHLIVSMRVTALVPEYEAELRAAAATLLEIADALVKP